MEVKVSVILPVYNVEKYLEQCIESLINQSLKEIEIICVDDGSTDSSLQILKYFKKKDDRIKIICQENQYAGVARNNGMAIAKGEYLVFLDSDDFFELNMLEEIYMKGVEQSADIVMFGARKYNNITSHFEDAPWYFHKEYVENKIVFNRLDFPDKILSITSPAPWTKAFKRSFIKKENLKFQALQNANDTFFTLIAISIAEKITWIDAQFVNYRINLTDNIQSNKEKNPCCFIEAYRSVYDELIRRNIYIDVEKSFVNVALSGIAFNLKTIKSYGSLRKIYKSMGNKSFLEMCLLNYPKEFYFNNNDYNEVLSVYYILKQIKRIEKQKNKSSEYQVLKDSYYDNDCSISVIIPIYNVEKYVSACLDSITNQTFKDIEIICVNDGTKDNSMDMVSQFARNDNRFKIIEQENQGLSAARNHGMNEAKGKYIYFMDSDDILEIDALEELYNLANQNNLDLIYFDAKCFSEDKEGKEFIKKNNLETNYIRNYFYSKNTCGQNMFKDMVRNKEFRTSVCLQFIKKNFLLEHNILFHEGVFHEDNAFTLLSMLSSKRVGYINKTFFNRRYRANSIMTRNKTFEHSYGYFRSYIDFIKRNEIYDSLDDETKSYVHEILKGFLMNSRNIYAKLSLVERNSYKGLDFDEMNIFDLEIVQPGQIKSELIEKQKKLQNTYNEKYERGIKIKELQNKVKLCQSNEKKLYSQINELNLELNHIKKSRSYKLASKIAKIYRKILMK